jgi:hypothetical protein
MSHFGTIVAPQPTYINLSVGSLQRTLYACDLPTYSYFKKVDSNCRSVPHLMLIHRIRKPPWGLTKLFKAQQHRGTCCIKINDCLF